MLEVPIYPEMGKSNQSNTFAKLHYKGPEHGLVDSGADLCFDCDCFRDINFPMSDLKLLAPTGQRRGTGGHRTTNQPTKPKYHRKMGPKRC